MSGGMVEAAGGIVKRTASSDGVAHLSNARARGLLGNLVANLTQILGILNDILAILSTLGI
jgi:hypothetical protein